uniref:Uncharacterized protein n=1 Tax=Cacopsylla melanoneura TaxID=428564 RepID=A0A8D9E8Q3_9HEMI
MANFTHVMYPLLAHFFHIICFRASAVTTLFCCKLSSLSADIGPVAGIWFETFSVAGVSFGVLSAMLAEWAWWCIEHIRKKRETVLSSMVVRGDCHRNKKFR